MAVSRLGFKLTALIVAAGLLVGYLWGFVYRPVAAIAGHPAGINVNIGRAHPLTWPNSGQAAIAANGFGMLAIHGSKLPTPTASVAKVVTALAVLKQKPVGINSAGATITLTNQDVALYRKYLAEDGAVIKVVAGERLTEKQILQAMLIASANNLADSLAIWAFGSINAYTNYANRLVKTYGMNLTTISDASGWSPHTVSTASDLVLLGQKALVNPLIAQIVRTQSTTFPQIGTIKNTNHLLGTEGFIGIKTGHTDQSGGCLLFAARFDTGAGHFVTVIGAILKAHDSATAALAAQNLLASVKANFSFVTLIKSQQVIGNYQPSWSKSVTAVAKRNMTAIVWKFKPPKPDIILNAVSAPALASQSVGQVRFTVGEVTLSAPVVLSKNIGSPGWLWRLARINN